MEDRFKFRCWDSNRNIMLLPETNDKAGIDEWYDSEWNIFIGALSAVQAGGWRLMQCTGLKDKNGKLVYEGDLVDFQNQWMTKPERWEIGWCEIRAAFTANGYPIGQIGDNGGWLEEKDFEIKGNRFENPELLEAHDE